MGIQILGPDSEQADFGLVPNDHTDHDSDPDIAFDTVSALNNDTLTIWTGNFPTPVDIPDGVQVLSVGIEQFDAGQTGIPTVQLTAQDDGVGMVLGPVVNVGTYAVLSVSFSSGDLLGPTGAFVQLQVIGTPSGGGPGVKNSVNIGHMKWIATYRDTTEILVADVFIKQTALADLQIATVQPADVLIDQLVTPAALQVVTAQPADVLIDQLVEQIVER